MMNKRQINYLRYFFFLFYTIGAIGMLVPQTRSLFILLTPFALLASTAVLLMFHQHYTFKNTLVFLFIMIAGYGVEVAGVNTGLIFGEYKYGPTLGFQWLNTPLLIGVNWLLLTYSTASISRLMKIHAYWQATIATGLMLGYDYLLEPVAIRFGMWSWQDVQIPAQNYIAWGVISFLFQFLLIQAKIQLKNKMAVSIFLSQLLYLILLKIL